MFTSNRLVRFDGPLSVLRGFTETELMVATSTMREFSWTVRCYAGFQLALVGRRNSCAKIGRASCRERVCLYV